MKRSLLVVALTLVVCGSVTTLWLLSRDDREEQGHFDRGETRLVVSNLAHSSLSLYRAGRTPADTARLAEFDGTSIWLRPGNYFLRSDDAGHTSYFPVPLTGYTCGPDDDGSFVVTVRPMPGDAPPRLLGSVPEFVFIPGGSFLLGDRQNPGEPHYVWLTGYFIAPFEVSNDEFREFLNDPAGYYDSSNWTEGGKVWRLHSQSHTSASFKAGDRDYGRFGRPDQPLSRVTWFEANAFCKWMSRKYAERKWQFSLPTDAEWEKAARGPDIFDYALSMFISDAEEKLYNWKKNPDAPVPVFGIAASQASWNSNRFGLYHMTGNVVEWTQSIDRPYNREHPYADDDRNLDDTPGLRTARGGSWYSAAISYMYIPYRDSFQPEHYTQDIGFRIVARRLP